MVNVFVDEVTPCQKQPARITCAKDDITGQTAHGWPRPSFRSLLLRSLIGLSVALALHTSYQAGHLCSSGSAAQTGGHTEGWPGQLPATC